MCFTLSNVRSPRSWNWEGDEIVNDPIILAARKIPSTHTRYDIDIREFLLSRENAVLRRELNALLDGLDESDRSRFRSNKHGSFDFRVQKILAHVSNTTRYIKSKSDRTFDSWLFPDETLTRGGGDCEDRAFLLASLMLAAGLSGYVIRVVLGKLYNVAKDKSWDHAWVMYKTEDGRWITLEPLLATREAARAERRLAKKRSVPGTDEVEYIPYFAFNDAHLWRMSNNTVRTTFTDYIDKRAFWTKFNPDFATQVHNQLIDRAIPELNWADRQYVKAVSLSLDSVSSYDPRDHFDNGYIEEGWALVNERVSRKDSLNSLACAIHSVADFYAHSSYAVFAGIHPSTYELELYDPANLPSFNPVYDSGVFDLRDARFTVNPRYYKQATRQPAITYSTRKKIISGRFAQPGDPHQGFLEKIFVYIPYAMRHARDFPPRGGLPHHNEMAVDSESGGTIPEDHRLFQTVHDYDTQFKLRCNAAERHIKKIYAEWKS